MAVHRNRRAKLRQAGRKLLAHVRRGRKAIQRRRASAVDAGDPEISRLDERLQPLAEHVREGRFFESPWQLIRFGNLQGVSDEDAVQTLAAWCKRQGFEMSFVTRQVGSVHVVLRAAESEDGRPVSSAHWPGGSGKPSRRFTLRPAQRTHARVAAARLGPRAC